VWWRAAASSSTATRIRISLAGVTFFLIYLASTAWMARGLAASDLRRKAAFEDEGIVIIVARHADRDRPFLRLASASPGQLGPGSVAALRRHCERAARLAILLTVMAFHYAHLFYAKAAGGGDEAGGAGGLDFPETAEPPVSDFVFLLQHRDHCLRCSVAANS
jgi:uncharacterized membrane protein